jgi:hypothetical protein
MNIVAYDNAKVTVLFPFEEVTPIRGANGPAIIASIAGRFRFLKSPDLTIPRTEQEKIGLRFENGIFGVGDSQIIIAEFVIFNDGVVISARTTEEGEVFWQTILEVMLHEHNFRDFSSTPVRRFVSQLVVEFDHPLERLINSYADIANSVSTHLSTVYDTSIPLGFARFDLEFDKIGQNSSLTVPRFIIERRQGTPFARERYYCSAPLRSRDHIAILERLEKTLA